MSGPLSACLRLLPLLALAAPVTFRHRRYDDLVRTLYKVHNECPYITRVYSVGRSVKGRHLYVLEFSDYPGIHEPRKPRAALGVSRAGPGLNTTSPGGMGVCVWRGRGSWTPPSTKGRLSLRRWVPSALPAVALGRPPPLGAALSTQAPGGSSFFFRF